MPDDTIGDLARQDLYPDETQIQPPQNAPGGLTPEDWMMSGQQPPAATYDYVPPQSWLQKAGDLGQKDVANYQTGGVPAVIGSLADTSDAQDLAGGFGGNIKGVEGKLSALADLAPHAPPFYSAVENAVAGAKQTTAPGQQWAGFLRNQPGVKPEEVSALKLGDLFDQTGAVTKQDLLDHIAANKVQLGEKVLGDDTAVMRQHDLIDAENKRLTDEYHAASGDLARQSEITAQMNANFDRMRQLLDENQPTKFSQYTLPGGENYRETLLTLPQKEIPSNWQVVPHPDDRLSGYALRNSIGEYATNASGAQTALWKTPEEAKFDIKNYAPTQLGDAAKSARMTEIEQKLQNPADYDTAELFDMRNEYRRLANETRDSPTFKSSHFDEPNILAHIRTNDRVIDGKKTLFVEEVQSDWHQKGKREGYMASPEEKQALDQKLQDVQAERAKLVASSNITDRTRYAELNDEEGRLIDEYNKRINDATVPDAPFKTTWPDLAMKRVIRQAAEGGYDKVAWTPGSVQADRYDLSKQLRELQYLKNEDGTFSIAGVTSKGEGFNHPDNVSADKLPDVVGKEMAQKIVNNEGKRARGHPANGGYFDGVDLKVGGEGMKGFYDQILPATVNKLVKKHGGRVGQGNIERPIRSRLEEVQGMEPRAAAAAMRLNKQMPVHTLDITPQLREMALKKGFPLFTAGGLVAGGAMGDLAKQDEYQ